MAGLMEMIEMIVKRGWAMITMVLVLSVLLHGSPALAEGSESSVAARTDISGTETTTSLGSDVTNEPTSIEFAGNVTAAMRQEADNVRKTFNRTVNRLFTPEPLGFSIDTFPHIYDDIIRIPIESPTYVRLVVEETRLLGAVGTIIILIFIVALTYSLTGQKKVLRRLEAQLLPLTDHVPDTMEPYLKMVLKLVAVVLAPLCFWGLHWLIQSFTGLQKSWFLFFGHFIQVWALGVASLRLIRSLFLEKLIPIPALYAKSIYRVLRIITLYIIFTAILFYGAEAVHLNSEYLALLKVILSLTVVLSSLTLIARKKEVLSLLPDLPYRLYHTFRSILVRLYTPAMVLTFLTGVLWSFGYRELCLFIWIKTWAVAVTIVVIGIAYHVINLHLTTYRSRATKSEAAEGFYKTLHAMVIFTTVIVLSYSVLSLLGIYEPLKRLISFPIIMAGNTPVSLWSFVRAGLIIYVFALVSRVSRHYFDHKVFPVIGIEEGLAYSINTFIGYLLLAFGALFALYSIGLDLRILMVFAGAIGIGIGLGLQNTASNIISGFALIFGQKIRKGDWIQAGDTMGYVKEVSLRVTKVVTRDNIEYLIPNSDLTGNTIINYTLTDPLIRVHIPVGVSYRADPLEVREVLLSEASLHSGVSRSRKLEVWFTEYGDSAINFSLLIWIDVRSISEEQVRSELYFEIFKALAAKGIEIPFPQRDVHIRTDVSQGKGLENDKKQP